MKNIKQNIFAIVAAMIWGFAFSAQSDSAALGMGTFTFNALRAVFGALALVVIILIFARCKVTKRYLIEVTKGGFFCGLFLFTASALQQFGLSGTDSGKGGFLTAMYIITVPILGIFMGKKISKAILGCILIAVAGMFFLCVDIKNGLSVNLYDLILVLCAFVFAGHILCIDHYTNKVNGIHLSIVQVITSGVLSGILAIMFEDLTLECFKACLWNVLYVGVFSSGVAYTLQILAQKDSNPTVISMLLSLESVFALIGGAIFLKERLEPREYIGCAIMLVAVVLAQLVQAKEQRIQNEKTA